MTNWLPSHTSTHTVTPADTAHAVGSGSLDVLGTPRLVAWCEAATCQAIESDLDPGSTSVGTDVHVEHLAASRVGRRVEIKAVLVTTEGRRREFEVSARDPDADVELARCEIVRMIVDVDRFLARLP